jgi:hypothetical protein
MDMMSLQDVEMLSRIHEAPSISLYLPTFRQGQEVQQNAIRFKNVLAKAADALRTAGLKERQVIKLLAPASRLQTDKYFWEHQMEGLAFFRTPRKAFTFCIPVVPEEQVVIGSRLHLKPLFSLFAGNGRFYALALGRSHARLYLGTRFSVLEQAVPRLPSDASAALRRRQARRQLQLHTTAGARPGGGTQPAVFHGQGNGKEREKEEILRFYRLLDREVSRVLRGERAPLVLVGLEYLCPIYRTTNSYAGLMEPWVDLNAENLTSQELHTAAWGVVEPYFKDLERRRTQAFQSLSQSGKASGDIREIVPAAVYKRVDTLFLPLGRSVHGRFDRSTGAVSLGESERNDEEDLLDLAAVQTLKSGGSVLTVRPEDVPGGSACAALFRY